MIIILKKNISSAQKELVLEEIKNLGCVPSEQTVDGQSILLFSEDTLKFEIPFDFSNMEGVAKVISNKSEFPKVSQKSKSSKSIIKVGNYEFTSGNLILIAGPCSIENEEQAYEIASAVQKSGAHILRGGAFKPRTSPYSFQGLGNDGLHILNSIKKNLKMPIITEVMDARHLDSIEPISDILQIGTRNMQNFTLLKEVGKSKKPILLKRGLSSTVKEWLLSAEYILNQGNDQVILCERGIRSFDTETRNLLDLSVVPLIKNLSHLPIIVDPSHALGRRDLIESMSLAAVAAGSDGLMIEVHDKPHKALSDGAQALSYDAFDNLSKKVRKLALAMDLKCP